MKCWETLWFSKGLSLFSPLNGHLLGDFAQDNVGNSKHWTISKLIFFWGLSYTIERMELARCWVCHLSSVFQLSQCGIAHSQICVVFFPRSIHFPSFSFVFPPLMLQKPIKKILKKKATQPGSLSILKISPYHYIPGSFQTGLNTKPFKH